MDDAAAGRGPGPARVAAAAGGGGAASGDAATISTIVPPAPGIPTRIFSAIAEDTICAVTLLDMLALQGVAELSVHAMPSIMAHMLLHGGALGLRRALGRHDVALVRTADGAHSWRFMRAGGGLTAAGLADLADEVSHDMEPTITGGGAPTPAADDVAPASSSGATSLSAPPASRGIPHDFAAIVPTRHGAMGIHVDILRLAATTLGRVTAALRAAQHAGALPPPRALDLSALEETVVVPTSFSGEDFMVPYEISFVADSAAKHIGVPNVYEMAAAHIHYMAEDPESYRYRTFGRSLIGFSCDACITPAHEVVHVLQGAAGQVDSSRDSWQAEHDASRAELLLLSTALAPCSASSGSAGGDAGAALPPWLLPACLMYLANGVMRMGARAGGLDAGDAGAAAAAAGGAPPPPTMYDAFVAWFDAFGLESPAEALKDVGSFQFMADVLKTLSSVMSALTLWHADMVAGKAAASFPEALASPWAATAAHRLLGIMFGSRTYGPNVWADDNKAAVHASVAAAAIPPALRLDAMRTTLLAPPPATLHAALAVALDT